MQPDHGGEKLDSDPKVNQPTWDEFSEQPYPIRRQFSVLQRLKDSFCPMRNPPSLACSLSRRSSYSRITIVRISTKELKRRTEDRSDFMGVAVALHSCDGRASLERSKLWEFARYCFVCTLGNGSAGGALGIYRIPPGLRIRSLVMQDRQHSRSQLWHKNLNTIVQRFWPRIKDYQIGQGINRSKWGVFSSDEFWHSLQLPKILGRTIRKFICWSLRSRQPIPFIRSLLNGYKITGMLWAGSLCRSPRLPAKQAVVCFRFYQKIYHFVACVLCSNRANHRFWITEVNWPLEGQTPYAPTEEKEYIGEAMLERI